MNFEHLKHSMLLHEIAVGKRIGGIVLGKNARRAYIYQSMPVHTFDVLFRGKLSQQPRPEEAWFLAPIR